MFDDSGSSVLLVLLTSCLSKYLALNIISSQFFLRRRKREYAGHLARATIYPLKSMKGLELSSASCEFRGIESQVDGTLLKDRSWMVITENGNIFTGRNKPQFVLIVPSIKGDQLQLDAPGKEPVRIPVHLKRNDGKLHGTKVWGIPVEGIDCGDEVAKWISSYLETPGLRLIYHAEGTANQIVRNRKSKWHKSARDIDQIAYQDEFPFMMMVEPSLKDLNQRLTNKVTTDQFRPNFVLSTDLPPFDEDDWVEIFIGEAIFRNAKPCDRCLMTIIDPKTGTSDKEKEPLKTLRSYRLTEPELGQAPCLGTFLTLIQPGRVRVGDKVYITRRLQTS